MIMPCYLEVVLTDGLVFVEECGLAGGVADKLRKLVLERGEKGDGYSSLEIEATASIYTTPYDPGRFTGPPEECYPPEGGDFDLEELKHAETGIDFVDVLPEPILKEIEIRLAKQQKKEADDDRGEWLYEQRRDRE